LPSPTRADSAAASSLRACFALILLIVTSALARIAQQAAPYPEGAQLCPAVMRGRAFSGGCVFFSFSFESDFVFAIVSFFFFFSFSVFYLFWLEASALQFITKTQCK
jgi:hypothetical protein